MAEIRKTRKSQEAVRNESLFPDLLGGGQIYILRYDYIYGTLSVSVNGILLREGTDADYIEIGNRKIQFNIIMDRNDQVVCNYIKPL